MTASKRRPRLDQMLSSNETKARESALTALLLHPPLIPRFIEAVRDNAEHSEPAVRTLALSIAEQIAPVERETFLRLLALDPSPEENVRALFGLARGASTHGQSEPDPENDFDADEDRALEAVVNQLSHSSPAVRDAAAHVLPRFGEVAVKPIGRRLHRSECREEVIAAARALARMGSVAEEIEPVIWNRTRDADGRVALASLAAWIRVTGRTSRGWRDQLKPFRTALSQRDFEEREFAIEQIAELRELGRPLAGDIARCAGVHPEALRTLIALDAPAEQKLAASERAIRTAHENPDPRYSRFSALLLSTVASGPHDPAVTQSLLEVVDLGDQEATGVARAALTLRSTQSADEEGPHGDQSSLTRQAS